MYRLGNIRGKKQFGAYVYRLRNIGGKKQFGACIDSGISEVRSNLVHV